jgi:integrase
MKLADAIEFTFQYRPAWKRGKSDMTNRINTGHGLRILGNLECDDIKSFHFSQLQEALVQEGKGPATVNRVCAAVHTVLAELYLNDLVKSVPTYRRMTEPDTKRGYFTRIEVGLLVDRAKRLPIDGQLMEDSIRFAVLTGCRSAEMRKLKWSDVDFDNRELTFRDVKTGESTGKKDHVLPINDPLCELLERMHGERIDEMVFHWSSKDALCRRFKLLKSICGLPEDHRTWHTLRHTCGTWMVEAGVPIRSVMATLNHKNIETTLRYAKGTKKAVAEALDALDFAL